MNQGPRWTLLMKKIRALKSRATIPLSDKCVFALYTGECSFENFAFDKRKGTIQELCLILLNAECFFRTPNTKEGKQIAHSYNYCEVQLSTVT
jgi:hypothetical protein